MASSNPAAKASVSAVAGGSTTMGPNDITVQTWDDAQREYRIRLQARLVLFFNKNATLKQGPDPFNTTPLNAIMAQVPVHLLEHSKTGVAEINITVKLMRVDGTQVLDQKDLCPAVNVNIDGRNTTSGRGQLPHIGFSVQNGAESHIFVKDALPKGITVRGKLGAPIEPYATATLVTPRGKVGPKPSNDAWHVTAEIRRRPYST